MEPLFFQQSLTVYGYGVGYLLTISAIYVVTVPHLALVVLPSVALLAALISRFEASSSRVAELADGQARLFGIFVETLSGLPTLRATCCEPGLYASFCAALDRDSAAVRTAQRSRHALFTRVEVLPSHPSPTPIPDPYPYPYPQPYS